MSNRYDAFEERLVNLEDKLVALQEQVNIKYINIINYPLYFQFISEEGFKPQGWKTVFFYFNTIDTRRLS